MDLGASTCYTGYSSDIHTTCIESIRIRIKREIYREGKEREKFEEQGTLTLEDFDGGSIPSGVVNREINALRERLRIAFERERYTVDLCYQCGRSDYQSFCCFQRSKNA